MVKELQDTDIYLWVQLVLWSERGIKQCIFSSYSGHGSGSHLIPDRENLQMNAAAVLLGCSSADINRQGIHWELSGAPIKFMLSGR